MIFNILDIDIEKSKAFILFFCKINLTTGLWVNSISKLILV